MSKFKINTFRFTEEISLPPANKLKHKPQTNFHMHVMFCRQYIVTKKLLEGYSKQHPPTKGRLVLSTYIVIRKMFCSLLFQLPVETRNLCLSEASSVMHLYSENVL